MFGARRIIELRVKSEEFFASKAAEPSEELRVLCKQSGRAERRVERLLFRSSLQSKAAARPWSLPEGRKKAERKERKELKEIKEIKELKDNTLQAEAARLCRFYRSAFPLATAGTQESVATKRNSSLFTLHSSLKYLSSVNSLLELLHEPCVLFWNGHVAVVEQQCVVGLSERRHLTMGVHVVAFLHIAQYVGIVGGHALLL